MSDGLKMLAAAARLNKRSDGCDMSCKSDTGTCHLITCILDYVDQAEAENQQLEIELEALRLQLAKLIRANDAQVSLSICEEPVAAVD